MRTRLFVAIIFIIVLTGVIIYFLIPSPLTASGRISFSTSTNGAYATLTKQQNWDQWTPETFFITNRLVNTVELNVKNNKTTSPVSILLIPVANDSVTIVWNTTFPVTNNPVSKIRQYAQASVLSDKMNDALNKFQSFVSHNENIYGFQIGESSTKDTLLIATRFSIDSFPSNQLVYTHIDKLRTYATTTGANISGPPMLNVSTSDSATYNCMVALPINKKVAGNGAIFFVRMVPGRFLTSEVKGGPYTIASAHRMMDQYFKDFNRVTMGIPFEYLVTDRLQEPDTTKWITRIYGPVY